MMIVRIDPRTLGYVSLQAACEANLHDEGDYVLLHDEVVLHSTFRWGAVMDQDGRYQVQMIAFTTEDGEVFIDPIYKDGLDGLWTVPGLPRVGIPDLDIMVEVRPT